MQWIDFINEEKKKEYYQVLKEKVDYEYEHFLCHPDYKNIYHAFSVTKFDDVKVVILGQDPYHEVNQAHGLAFSVLCEKLPPSLQNIYKEMETDLGVKINQDGNLDYLAKQGVLLLNTTLTVRNGLAFSHKDFGWDIFTDNVIKRLNEENRPIVFILWGSPAQKKMVYLNNPHHLIIKSAHPSPLSAYRGFFGSKPFSKTNDFLIKNGVEPIKWYK
ncbi:MAG: uracil-DNA glycosylase [Acholeplasmatales bacterium]|nr:uracil-DNA glycosylase [Acholeplasmatales bacterium]